MRFILQVNETVIASAAKQSIAPRKERMDCFVAALLAMASRRPMPLLASGEREKRHPLRSILGDGGAAEGVVHADRDQIEVLTDAIDDHRGAAGRRTRDNTERRQSDVSASHEEMVVFDGDRPAGEKAIFKTGADRAAGPGVAGGSGNQPRCAGDIVVKSGVNPWAALSEKERMS